MNLRLLYLLYVRLANTHEIFKISISANKNDNIQTKGLISNSKKEIQRPKSSNEQF